MQETQVQTQVREDPTCLGASEPMHNYWACLCPRAQEPKLLNPGAWTTEARAPKSPMLHNKRSHCNEKPMHHNERAAPAHSN